MKVIDLKEVGLESLKCKNNYKSTNMEKYYSGEEIKIGDHITTDYGCDHNIIMKIIDNDKDKEDYGLDFFGVLMSSSQVGGIIFVSFEEICSQDTKFVHRKTNCDKLIDI